jgi:phosphoribosylglycinamide formyltransferase-1
MTAPEFISEAIRPLIEGADAGGMAAGGPALPRAFSWRHQQLEVVDVLRSWRETSPCRHGSGEAYVRKHWFEVRTADGATARIYFERQARGRKRTDRWWLYTLEGETRG